MKKKLSELTLEELYKRKTTLKAILISFIMVVTVAAIILICLKAKPVLYISLLTFPTTLLPLSIAFKQINDEIKLRNTTTKT